MNKEKLGVYKKELKSPYTGLTEELEDKINGVKVLEINFDKMTKDELNDYAASIGMAKEVNTNMSRKEMLDAIKKQKVN